MAAEERLARYRRIGCPVLRTVSRALQCSPHLHDGGTRSSGAFDTASAHDACRGSSENRAADHPQDRRCPDRNGRGGRSARHEPEDGSPRCLARRSSHGRGRFLHGALQCLVATISIPHRANPVRGVWHGRGRGLPIGPGGFERRLRATCHAQRTSVDRERISGHSLRRLHFLPVGIRARASVTDAGCRLRCGQSGDGIDLRCRLPGRTSERVPDCRADGSPRRNRRRNGSSRVARPAARRSSPADLSADQAKRGNESRRIQRSTLLAQGIAAGVGQGDGPRRDHRHVIASSCPPSAR